MVPITTTTTIPPGTTTTLPGQPGITTTLPGQPGTTTTLPGQPGTTTTLPGQPGTTTTLPGQSITTTKVFDPSVTTTTQPGQPGTTTTLPGQSGTTTTLPSGGNNPTPGACVNGYALQTAHASKQNDPGKFGGYYTYRSSCEELCTRDYGLVKCIGYMYEPANRGACTIFQYRLGTIEEASESVASIYYKC